MDNEIIKRKNDTNSLVDLKYNEYSLQNTIAESMVPIAKLHGFKCKVRMMEPQSETPTKKDGVYLIVSKEQKYIDGADALTNKDLYQEFINQRRRGMFYPNVMVFKINHNQKLTELATFIDKIQLSEFVTNRFREWKIPFLDDFLDETKNKILNLNHASPEDVYNILNNQSKKIGITETSTKLNILAREIYGILAQNSVDKGESIVNYLNDNLYPTVKIPEKIENNAVRVLYFDYREMYFPENTQQERDEAARMLDYHLSILESGMSEIDFLKANKNNKSFKFKDKLALIDGKSCKPDENYHSKSPKNLSLRQLIDSSSKVTSMIVKSTALEYFEKLLEKEPNVYYNIDPVPFSTPDYADFYTNEDDKKRTPTKRRYYNKVTFDEDDMQVIASNAMIAEYPQLRNRVKYWTTNKIDENEPQRYAISFPIGDLDMFIAFADAEGIEYYIDMNGTYVDASTSSIGIVTESKEEMLNVNNVIKEMYNARCKYKLCYEVDEIRKQKKIEQTKSLKR